jgi:hypothetical protein
MGNIKTLLIPLVVILGSLVVPFHLLNMQNISVPELPRAA